MTKKRITKASSKSLSDTYRFKRLLKSPAGVAAEYKDRDERINRIRPIKRVAIINELPADVCPTYLAPEEIEATVSFTMVPESTDGAAIWPFRIEFIEQVCGLQDIWIVEASTGNRGFATPSMSIEVLHLENPSIIGFQKQRRHDTGHRLTESELLDLEHFDIYILEYDKLILRGTNNKETELPPSNILPFAGSLYNAPFYNREVAHLYADSLHEHFRRYYP